MSWLDWLNLGLNVVDTAISLNNSKKISQLQAQGASEAIVQAVLNELRQLIFDSREKLKAIEPHAQDHPLAAFTLASLIGWRFESIGLTPRMFPEFRDKEFVSETLAQVNRLLTTTQSRLSPDELARGKETTQSMIEMSLLRKAVSHQEIVEKMNTAEQEKRQLRAEHNKAPIRVNKKMREWGNLSLGIGVIICMGSFCLSQIANSVFSVAGNSSQGLSAVTELMAVITVCLGPFLGVAAVGAGALMLINSAQKTSKPSTRIDELTRYQESLRPNLANEETRKEIVAAFGLRSAADYKQLLDYRQALVQHTLGGLGEHRFLQED